MCVCVCVSVCVGMCVCAFEFLFLQKELKLTKNQDRMIKTILKLPKCKCPSMPYVPRMAAVCFDGRTTFH